MAPQEGWKIIKYDDKTHIATVVALGSTKDKFSSILKQHNLTMLEGRGTNRQHVPFTAALLRHEHVLVVLEELGNPITK